jgi:micrococcal nuclease
MSLQSELIKNVNTLSFLKRNKWKPVIIIAIILVTSIVGLNTTQKQYTKKIDVSKINLDLPYKVTKVVDGDTFDINVSGQTVKVRMIGVDTPETVDPRKTVQCFGIEASNMTKKLILDKTVTLKNDPTQGISDKFGRLLAYVYRDDGLFVNQYLIENGYAHEYTYSTPYQKQDDFKKYSKVAKENRLGLWGDICEGK